MYVLRYTTEAVGNLRRMSKSSRLTSCSGSVEKGFEGIEEAVRESLKEAIRNYYRKTIKNKPKEITGAVLIRKFPTLGIDAGRYVINLDFFLECGKIIEYSVY